MRGPASCDIRAIQFDQQCRSREISRTVVGLTTTTNSSTTQGAESYLQQSQKKDDTNNFNSNENTAPIWKVGRMLVDSLSKGKMRRSKIFGAPLEDLPLNKQGLPKIAYRLCLFLECYGLKEDNLFTPCKKQNKFVERYKISFERIGDADLENSPNVKIAATLLKLWLRDLPQPLILPSVSAKLIAGYRKYNMKEIYDINSELSKTLLHLSALNLGVLFIVVRLLNRYVDVNSYSSSSSCYEINNVSQLSQIFTPILMRESSAEHMEIIAVLITNFSEIFNDRIIDKVFRFYLISNRKNETVPILSSINDVIQITEFKERNRFSTYSVDKLIRCNSEEKLSPNEDISPTLTLNNKRNRIRRVNSHEDFGKHSEHQHPIKLMDIITDEINNNYSNIESVVSNNNGKQSSTVRNDTVLNNQYIVADSCSTINRFTPEQQMSEVRLAPPPINMMEDSEQEKIRNHERFAPQFSMNKKICNRRKRKYDRTKQIQNFAEKFTHIDSSTPQAERHSNVTIATSSAFDLQNQDVELNSPSSSSSPNSTSSSTVSSPVKSPPVYEKTFHIRSNSEPLTSFYNCSSAHHPADNTTYKNRSLSPRNSVTISRRSFSETWSGQPYSKNNLSAIELQILNVSKHLYGIKKRMKRFEENYCDRSDDFPTLSKKLLSHPEYKQMSSLAVLLRTNLKQLKKEASENHVWKAHRDKSNSLESVKITATAKEDVIKQTEKTLYEQRKANNRPEKVENMSFEQLQEEKLLLQKIIHDIERQFGEGSSRNETLFRPIYNHLLLIKRFLAKSTASLKLKESSSDLATIKENEAMEFGNVSENVIERTISPSICQDYCIMSNIYDDNEQLHNIHSLSPNELMAEYKVTKYKKRKLKQQLQIFEQETANKSVNDIQHCISSLRVQYKRSKAKLKLLDALLIKVTK